MPSHVCGEVCSAEVEKSVFLWLGPECQESDRSDGGLCELPHRATSVTVAAFDGEVRSPGHNRPWRRRSQKGHAAAQLDHPHTAIPAATLLLFPRTPAGTGGRAGHLCRSRHEGPPFPRPPPPACLRFPNRSSDTSIAGVSIGSRRPLPARRCACSCGTGRASPSRTSRRWASSRLPTGRRCFVSSASRRISRSAKPMPPAASRCRATSRSSSARRTSRSPTAGRHAIRAAPGRRHTPPRVTTCTPLRPRQRLLPALARRRDGLHVRVLRAPDATLEEAQRAKLDYVCRKLRLAAGRARGRGGLRLGRPRAPHGARTTACPCAPTTCRDEQIAYARAARARRRPGGPRRLRRGRLPQRSTGAATRSCRSACSSTSAARTIRALGQVIDRVLDPDQRPRPAALHRPQPPAAVQPLDRRKRIFPGAYPPTLGEVIAAVLEPHGLLGRSTSRTCGCTTRRTLEHWRTRFERRVRRRARAMFDDRSSGCWRLYLAGSQAAFHERLICSCSRSRSRRAHDEDACHGPRCDLRARRPMDRCDVLVVGGGPAGSTCAWRLRARRARRGRARPRALSARQGRAPAGSRRRSSTRSSSTSLNTVRAGRFSRSRDFAPVSSAARRGSSSSTAVSFGIRRCEFDAFLLQRAKAWVLTGALGELRRDGAEWVVNGALRTAMLVGAGGHFCPVARRLGVGEAGSDAGGRAVVAQETEFALRDPLRIRCTRSGPSCSSGPISSATAGACARAASSTPVRAVSAAHRFPRRSASSPAMLRDRGLAPRRAAPGLEGACVSPRSHGAPAPVRRRRRARRRCRRTGAVAERRRHSGRRGVRRDRRRGNHERGPELRSGSTGPLRGPHRRALSIADARAAAIVSFSRATRPSRRPPLVRVAPADTPAS